MRTRLARLAAWLGLALLITWPMARHPLTVAVGLPQASVGCHVWLIWWAGHHLWPLHSDLIFYPGGADVMRLYGSDLLSPLLLGWLPPTLAYNLWVVALLTGAGLGAQRLARRVGASAGGAWVGGVIFESAPFFQHELLNGTSELLAAAALPWFAHGLLDLLDRPTRRGALGLGLLVGLAVAASAYNLFFLLMVAAVLVVGRLVSQRAPVFSRPVAVGSAISAGLAGAMILPMVWLHARHGLSSLSASRAASALTLPDSFAAPLSWIDPRDAVIPAILQQPDGERFAYWTTSTVYLGLVALALAGWGMLRGRRGGVWLTLAVVGALVAMGPTLGRTGLPLPGPALQALLPGFGITALHAYRYAVVVVLGVAVLASLAVRRPWWAALVLVDALWLGPVPWPAAVTPTGSTPTLDALAALPPGAVLTAPVRVDDLGDLGAMLVAQVHHGKPVQDGGIQRRAGPDAARLFTEVPLLSDLSRREGPRLPAGTEARWGLEQLREVGYRYLLVRRGTEVEGWAGGLLGAPVSEDPSWVLWTLDGGAAR